MAAIGFLSYRIPAVLYNDLFLILGFLHSMLSWFKGRLIFQAMAISEQIGYPDYILEEDNGKLDQEYIHVGSEDSLCEVKKKKKKWFSSNKTDTHRFFFCLQLKFSEESYFENILENLQATAQKAHKKLREPVDPELCVTAKHAKTNTWGWFHRSLSSPSVHFKNKKVHPCLVKAVCPKANLSTKDWRLSKCITMSSASSETHEARQCKGQSDGQK